MPMLTRSRVTTGKFPSIQRARYNFRPVKCKASMNGSLDGEGEICTIADVSYTNDTEGLTRLVVEVRRIAHLSTKAGRLDEVSEGDEAVVQQIQLEKLEAPCHFRTGEGLPNPHMNTVCCTAINGLRAELYIQVQEFNGLLHSIAWVLKGMDVRVVEAELSTDKDGVVKDVFLLTTLQGAALPDARALEVVERVRDFVMYCGTAELKPAVEWRSGNVAVSNQHDDYTLITIMDVENRILQMLGHLSLARYSRQVKNVMYPESQYCKDTAES